MIGNDIYEKTNPKEMDAYLDFVHKNGKFDVVIDGLNVVSWDWKRSVKERQGCERLEMALKDLFSKSRNPESLRLAVIGRQHVRRRWASVEKRFPQVAFFYSADVSHDDIFLLYAAANSGPSTYFLTRDKLRNYRSQMGSVAGLMARWQRNRQLFYTTADRRIHVMYPSSHRLQVFGDDKSLHIPYVNDHRSTVTGAVPDEWICALKR
ncbi:hypothetical protein CAPTEDRAFT_157105 [Capitella teleta]|uniref:PRORP domain-containing protein n=1 Tax=Capitella teleta TaxID=283909 RepID=R7T5T7_CAPTE|nr:hypothetical protein CAPTEDRAFT_157105 [Capitella teleta]|eukprot:ELT88675.1 hypothetical protein CAPTEDRAFT_157105 [Capitella teleta]